MARSRKRMSRRGNRRNFKKGLRTNRKNSMTYRGGIRL